MANVHQLDARDRKARALAIVICDLEADPSAADIAAWGDEQWELTAKVAGVATPSQETRDQALVKVIARRRHAARERYAPSAASPFDGLPS